MASYANLRWDAGWELRELIYAAPTTTLNAPFLQPEGGTFTESVAISITTPAVNASIYYTLDGTEPSQTSKAYTSPIVLSVTATVKAKAFLGGYLPSNTVTAQFIKTVTQQVDTPAMTPNGADSPVNTISTNLVSGET